MKTPVIDGRSIDHFIPAHLRDMFYRHPIPQYKYAIHDGITPYDFKTNGLVLYLPLWALKNSSFKSVDPYGHLCSVTGALWRPNGHYFDGSDDKIEIPDSPLWDFGGDFTIQAWFKGSAPAGTQSLIIGRSTGTGNAWGDIDWCMTIASTGVLRCQVSNNGAAGTSIDGSVDISDGPFHFLEWTRSGDVFTICVNTITDGTETLSLTIQNTSNKVRLGWGYDRYTYTKGTISEVWIYSRALATLERQHNYLATKWRY